MASKASEGTPKPECGAKVKGRPGKLCTKPAMANGRCYIHGGATPQGVDAPQFKHGKYSKHLVALDGIDERLEDPTLVDSRRPIAAQEIVLARCLQLAEDAVGDEAVEKLHNVMQAAEAMSKAQQRYWQTALAGKNAIAYTEFIGLMIRLGNILEEVCGAELARLAMARADKELCNGALRLSG